MAALQKASSNLQLEDFYTVGLWNYCWGDEQPDGKHVVKGCSPRKNSFWFDPVEVWKLNQTGLFDDKMEKALNATRKFAGWMFASYMIAIVLTVAEFLVGLAAIFSRWGSLVTTIVSTVRHSHGITINSDSKLTVSTGSIHLRLRRCRYLHSSLWH